MIKKNILVRDSIQVRQDRDYSKIFNTMWFLVLLIIVIASTAGCKKKKIDTKTEPIGADPVAAAVTVKESIVIRKASRELLGMNNDWAGNQRILMEDSPSLELRSDYYTVMQNFPLPLSRMAGSDSQFFMWKKTLGTFSERTGFPNQWHPMTPMNFGVMEWLKSVQAVTPDAAFVWTFNMRQDNAAADASDLVEFLTGNGVYDPNGGINWAKKRMDLGIINPVKVIFELGNELDWIGSSSWSIDKYITESRKIIDAVRLIEPDAKFAMFAKTAPWANNTPYNGNWRDWHKKILQELGKDIDYISFHPYYLGYSLAFVDAFINSLRDDIVSWERSAGNLNASSYVKIYISEHGVWPLSNPSDNFTAVGYRTRNLRGSLGTAEFISRMYQRPEVAMATLHAFIAGPWYAINKGTSGLYLSGIGEMMKVMNQALGTNVVRTNVTGNFTDITQKEASFTVNAMTTQNGGLNLVLINRDSLIKRDVSFKFEKTYKLVKKTIFTGASMGAETKSNNPITINTVAITDESLFNHEEVPDKSLLVLYLVPKK